MVGFEVVFAMAGGGILSYTSSKYQIEEDKALDAYYKSVAELYKTGITEKMFESHKTLKKAGSNSRAKLLEDFMKKDGVKCSDLLDNYYNMRAKVEHLRVDKLLFDDSYNPYLDRNLT